MPFTAAMTGFQKSQLFGPMLSPGSLNMNGVLPEPIASSGVNVVSPSPPICSIRSMPVQKAFSPAPVSTTHRTSSWRRSPRQRARSSRCITELNAFSCCGRFSVTYATPARSS